MQRTRAFVLSPSISAFSSANESCLSFDGAAVVTTRDELMAADAVRRAALGDGGAVW
jgi:hypothetical protein